MILRIGLIGGLVMGASMAGQDIEHIGQRPRTPTPASRIVILKVDGLGGDLLSSVMRQTDPATGKSRLPWLTYIFAEHGTVFKNFYTRGISLSAPSWSMLDTGRHTVIRGNVEYDRYTGYVYDYLNLVPFYLGYARRRQVDMPGVEVLDSAGIPLVIDNFRFPEVFQSFQLFQRGLRWNTLEEVLKRRFSSKVILAMVENAGTPSFSEILAHQTEDELKAELKKSEVLYLDYFTGDVDHEGHATNQPEALLSVLENLDALAGRIWTAIHASPLAEQSIFAIVSDHGMNNVPGIFSQTFSLPDLLNSPQGGAHHVVTNREQLSDYKLWALDPLRSRITNASTASFYLAGQAAHYPTAWLDIDGNERASVQLRNSDWNKIHILLLQLANPDLPQNVREAATAYLHSVIESHRERWEKTVAELEEEMRVLERAIEERKRLVDVQPKKWTIEQYASGEARAGWRLVDELQSWNREYAAYGSYSAHLRALLHVEPDPAHPFHPKISDLIPELALGDSNSIGDLQHYVTGPGPRGLVLDSKGKLDEDRSFRYVNYFSLLAHQQVRNNPQPQLSMRPIDIIAMRLPDSPYEPAAGGSQHGYWVYGDESQQLLILVDPNGRIFARPVAELGQDKNGKIHWTSRPWGPDLPLHLFEDSSFRLPRGVERISWLSQWHTEREWLEATHECRYSNGLIGIIEELSTVEENVPGRPGINPVLLRFERRRRELVQADFHIFAADHWNFNTRFPNPGGNHGSFFRISTHSVWMMAGAGVPTRAIEEPYDSLNFASTLLSLLGRTAPMPDRIVSLQ